MKCFLLLLLPLVLMNCVVSDASWAETNTSAPSAAPNTTQPSNETTAEPNVTSTTWVPNTTVVPTTTNMSTTAVPSNWTTVAPDSNVTTTTAPNTTALPPSPPTNGTTAAPATMTSAPATHPPATGAPPFSYALFLDDIYDCPVPKGHNTTRSQTFPYASTTIAYSAIALESLIMGILILWKFDGLRMYKVEETRTSGRIEMTRSKKRIEEDGLHISSSFLLRSDSQRGFFDTCMRASTHVDNGRPAGSFSSASDCTQSAVGENSSPICVLHVHLYHNIDEISLLWRIAHLALPWKFNAADWHLYITCTNARRCTLDPVGKMVVIDRS